MLPQRFQGIERSCREGWELARNVRGYLSEREANCIMIAAALSPARGANVEIGSFMGRSTVCLAHICKTYGLGKVVAIDPHTSPSETDPDLGTERTSLDRFRQNLDQAALADQVDVRVDFSSAAGKAWSSPIRFLWIDGDHTYEAARNDILMFKRHLVPGGLLLMHDVLGTHYGSLRAFVEEVLDSHEFGAAGFCGSIGWAQFQPAKDAGFPTRLRRKLLAIPARQLIPVAKSGKGLTGWNKLRYKLWRPLAPHGRITPLAFWKKIYAGGLSTSTA